MEQEAEMGEVATLGTGTLESSAAWEYRESLGFHTGSISQLRLCNKHPCHLKQQPQCCPHLGAQVPGT